MDLYQMYRVGDAVLVLLWMEMQCRPSPEAVKVVGFSLWMFIQGHMLLLLQEYFCVISWWQNTKIKIQLLPTYKNESAV